MLSAKIASADRARVSTGAANIDAVGFGWVVLLGCAVALRLFSVSSRCVFGACSVVTYVRFLRARYVLRVCSV